MTVGADEFLFTGFRQAQIGEEFPAICKARPRSDGSVSFPAMILDFDKIKSGQPWYFNISTFRPPAAGEVFRARMANIVRTHVIVLDDIGDHPKSKVPFGALRNFIIKPNYLLATREDDGLYNCQAGFFLAPTEPTKATRLINALIERGLSDPGMRSPNRWARLPGSTKHDSDYPATLLEWNP